MTKIDEVLRRIDEAILRRGWRRTNLAKALKKTDAWASQVFNADEQKRIVLTVPMLFEIAEKLGVAVSSLLPEEKKNPHEFTFDDYIWEVVQRRMRKGIKKTGE